MLWRRVLITKRMEGHDQLVGLGIVKPRVSGNFGRTYCFFSRLREKETLVRETAPSISTTRTMSKGPGRCIPLSKTKKNGLSRD